MWCKQNSVKYILLGRLDALCDYADVNITGTITVPLYVPIYYAFKALTSSINNTFLFDGIIKTIFQDLRSMKYWCVCVTYCIQRTYAQTECILSSYRLHRKISKFAKKTKTWKWKPNLPATIFGKYVSNYIWKATMNG